MEAIPQIRIELTSGVLRITLARPAKKNALTAEMYEALAQALERASADPSIHVVLIGADGADFCAGNDIADFLAISQSASALANSPAFRFLRSLASFDKPLVAAVCGRAIGIGTTMLLHCDLVYLAEDARLSAPFVDLALVPEAASSLLLPVRIGHARAFALFALGETLDCHGALSCGLANAALPVAQVAAHAEAVARRLAAKPAAALRATKRLMRDPGPLLAVIESERRVFTEQLQGAEARALFQSFLARSASEPEKGRE
jgi:enoyl-CoA hydratase/carnithine racemase